MDADRRKSDWRTPGEGLSCPIRLVVTDGKVLLWWSISRRTSTRISTSILCLDVGSNIDVLATSTTNRIPSSRRRRWLAYASDESGRYEVYVAGFRRRCLAPGVHEGGIQPVWGAMGPGFSTDVGTIWAGRDDRTRFEVGKPRLLFERECYPSEIRSELRHLADGRRFIITRTETKHRSVTELILVQNCSRNQAPRADGRVRLAGLKRARSSGRRSAFV